MSTDRWKPALRHLRASDPIMKSIIQRVGPCNIRPRRNYFRNLCVAIVNQQLSVKAAKTIWNRVLLVIDGPITPARVLSLRDKELRAAGLSGMKVSFLKDLSSRIEDGRLRLRFRSTPSEEEIIERLTQVKGIGRWSAEMFLMFSLNRPDIFPIDDIGIRNAMKLNYGLQRDQVQQMLKVAERWKPWRTIASWYLWRSLDANISD